MCVDYDHMKNIKYYDKLISYLKSIVNFFVIF